MKELRARMTPQEPIFKPIFGKSWNDLPPVMRRHYANRPYSDDSSTVEGTLDIMCKWYLKPMFWLLGTVPPYSELKVPVTVHFTSQTDGGAFCFGRIFHFRNRKPFHFRSHMTQVADNEVIEQMNYGICWHSRYFWDGERVILQHKGYSLRLGSFNIPLPITYLVGRGDAYEVAVSDIAFNMCVTLTHPLLGKIYEYKGQFQVVKEV